jgi:hypothetical protein
LPIPRPPIVTRFQLPPEPPPSPPSPVPSRPPSPIIFSPAALGYDPTTDTRIDPFADVSSTPPQTTFPIVRDASVSKRVPPTKLHWEGSSTPVSRRRRMFSNTSVPGKDRLSSLLLPISSSSTHPDKRPQSAVVGPVLPLSTYWVQAASYWNTNGLSRVGYHIAMDSMGEEAPPSDPANRTRDSRRNLDSDGWWRNSRSLARRRVWISLS